DAAVREQAVEVPMAHVVEAVPAGGPVQDLHPALSRADRLEPELEPVEPELEPAREGAGAALRQQAEAVVLGRGAPQLTPRPAAPRAELPQPARPAIAGRRPRAAAQRAAARARPQRELLPGDLVPGGRPLRRTAQEEAEGDEALPGGRGVKVELDLEPV